MAGKRLLKFHLEKMIYHSTAECPKYVFFTAKEVVL